MKTCRIKKENGHALLSAKVAAHVWVDGMSKMAQATDSERGKKEIGLMVGLENGYEGCMKMRTRSGWIEWGAFYQI